MKKESENKKKSNLNVWIDFNIHKIAKIKSIKMNLTLPKYITYLIKGDNSENLK